MRIRLLILLLCLPATLLCQVLSITPERPVVGETAVIEILQSEGLAEVVATSPMGRWLQRFDPGKKRHAISLPPYLESLLIGYREKGSALYQFTFVPLKNGKTVKWQAYFGTGQPTIGKISGVTELPSEEAQATLSALPSMPENRAEGRWYNITRIQSPTSRAREVLTWLEENPTTSMRTRLTQLLAATYAETHEHILTIAYGKMTLAMIPTDAMTLNGVAYAMAEAEVDMNQGLLYADRALTILSASDQLSRPEHLTADQWRLEILSAQAATMDTKAVLLTKLKRYPEAESNFQAALIRSKRDEIYLHYGLMLKDWGKESESKKILEEGLTLNGPHYGALLKALGR